MRTDVTDTEVQQTKTLDVAACGGSCGFDPRRAQCGALYGRNEERQNHG